MVTSSQKAGANVAGSTVHSTPPAARTTPPVTPAHVDLPVAGPDANCTVHQLEEALQLVEALQLTSEQKAKISQLTQAQSARCAEEKKHHHATHEQILALLTPEQRDHLQSASAGAEHCRHEGHPALIADVVRA